MSSPYSPALRMFNNGQPYVNVPLTTYDPTGDTTLEILIKPDSGPDDEFHNLMSSQSFFWHKYEGGGMSFGFGSSNVSYNETNPGLSNLFRSDIWAHFIVTIGSDNIVYFYRNGILLQSNTLTASRITTTVTSAAVGHDLSFKNNSGFNGSFALSRLYQRKFFQGDVTYNFNNLLHGQRQNLLFEFLFSKQVPMAELIKDSSGNGNHGTITNNNMNYPWFSGIPEI